VDDERVAGDSRETRQELNARDWKYQEMNGVNESLQYIHTKINFKSLLEKCMINCTILKDKNSIMLKSI
jgi:hypothetical protein